jgi:hypothetical protein
VKQRTPWLVCVFVSFIVLDLQLAICCDAPGYKVRTYNTEEQCDDRKKNSFPGMFFLKMSPGDKEILGPQRRNNFEKEKRLSTSYLGLLIILDF